MHHNPWLLDTGQQQPFGNGPVNPSVDSEFY